MNDMDKLAIRIAELFTECRNPPSTSLRLATVIDINPLRVQWGESVILSGTKLIVPQMFGTGHSIPYQYMNTSGAMVDATTTFKITLAIGDQVVIAPETAELLRWIVVDKI